MIEQCSPEGQLNNSYCDIVYSIGEDEKAEIVVTASLVLLFVKVAPKATGAQYRVCTADSGGKGMGR